MLSALATSPNPLQETDLRGLTRSPPAWSAVRRSSRGDSQRPPNHSRRRDHPAHRAGTPARAERPAVRARAAGRPTAADRTRGAEVPRRHSLERCRSPARRAQPEPGLHRRPDRRRRGPSQRHVLTAGPRRSAGHPGGGPSAVGAVFSAVDAGQPAGDPTPLHAGRRLLPVLYRSQLSLLLARHLSRRERNARAGLGAQAGADVRGASTHAGNASTRHRRRLGRGHQVPVRLGASRRPA